MDDIGQGKVSISWADWVFSLMVFPRWKDQQTTAGMEGIHSANGTSCNDYSRHRSIYLCDAFH